MGQTAESPPTALALRTPGDLPREKSDCNGVGSRVRPKLGHRVLNVGLDRLRGEEEEFSNVTTLLAGCDEHHDLPLASGEPVPRVRSSLARWYAVESPWIPAPMTR